MASEVTGYVVQHLAAVITEKGQTAHFGWRTDTLEPSGTDDFAPAESSTANVTSTKSIATRDSSDNDPKKASAEFKQGLSGASGNHVENIENVKW